MVYLVLFIVGLCVGSFLNVIIYRETREERVPRVPLNQNKFGSGRARALWTKKIILWLPSWATGRSCCDHCRKKIPWYDNIPLLSYFLLKGKCRYCRKKIPFQYPLTELLTGAEFVWIYFLIKSNLSFFSRFEGFYSFISLFLWLSLGACLLAIFMADLKYQLIPDSAVYGGIIITLIKIIADYRYTGMINFSLITSAVFSSLFFGFLVLITKGKGMGIGDIKLVFLMGLILGIPKIFASLMFAFLTGAAAGVILILTGKKKLKSKIAFGPFLIGGTVFALFWDNLFWKLLGF